VTRGLTGRGRRNPSGPRALAGMGLIEVLAAMVIFSTGAVVLFGWMADASNRLAVLRAEQRQLFVQLSAIEFAKVLNPMVEPRGQVKLGDGVLLSWQSRPLGDIDEAGFRGGLYEVGLYEVEIKGEASWGEVPLQRLRLAGWRQVREVTQVNPFGGGVPQ
jgi:general secretion pathway protein I